METKKQTNKQTNKKNTEKIIKEQSNSLLTKTGQFKCYRTFINKFVKLEEAKILVEKIKFFFGGGNIYLDDKTNQSMEKKPRKRRQLNREKIKMDKHFHMTIATKLYFRIIQTKKS